MRYWPAVLPLVLVAGCHNAPEPANNTAEANISAAAAAGQGADIDTYASNSLQTPSEAAASPPLPAPAPTPSPSATPAPAGPPAPGEPGGLADDRTPVSEAPFSPQSAQGAANVVQTYYGLLEAGKYRQAYQRWGNDGEASGMSAAAFAGSFAKYADYHANVGAPGRVDAGAGQRYVSVPVQVYGHLKDGGKPFAMRGEVTLHRTANIPGATAEQRTWHISNVALTPVSDEPPPLGPIDSGPDDGVPATAEADYHCADGYAFHIVFDNHANTGTVSVDGHRLVVLDAQRTGSGIWYKGAGYNLRGKGRDARFTRPGKAPVECTSK